MPHISVLSPVYRAEDCIAELCQRLIKSVSAISNDFEIILVEDRSPDNSWSAIVDQARNDPRIRGIRLARNVGQHRAITAGLDLATGDWVVVMDCDLQDPPEAIPLMYAKAKEGYEIVLAEFVERSESTVRQKLSSIFWSLLGRLSGMPFDHRIGNFRIMSHRVVKNFCSFREQSRMLGGITSLMGFTTTSLKIKRDKRYSGETSYNYRRLLSLAVDHVVSYSNKPLKVSIILGLITTTLAFMVSVAMVVMRLIYLVEVPGWTSVVVSLYLIGGIIIANLGVIGYYIASTFNEVKRRPLYIIENSTDDDQCDNRQSRDELAGHVVWITGLPGAGKSTLAEEVALLLRIYGSYVILLDEDELREVFNATDPNVSNHGRDGQLALAMNFAQLCKVIADQGATVVIATISLFREVHSWNRANLPGYFEVYLKVPLDELRRRDPKSIYRCFDSGELTNVAGLDLSVDEPESADWVVAPDPDKTIKVVAEELFQKLNLRKKS